MVITGFIFSSNYLLSPDVISCTTLYIIDGDTFDCSGKRIRLAGIDTPEMPGHCRAGRRCIKGDPYAAKYTLEGLMTGPVTCRPSKKDRYGRTVARCKSGNVDLSCAMLKAKQAVRRYGYISCF